MKSRLLLMAAAAVLAACGPDPGNAPKAVAPAPKQDVSAEFRPILEKALAGWATLDPANAAEYYAKDADAVFFDIAPLKNKGWDDYAAAFKKAAADWKSLKVTLNPDFAATRIGNVVYATYTIHFEVEPKKGPAMKADGRGTEIWEKREDKWLVIHEHASVPMP